MPGPMHGVRVIDLTQMISGPLGAMMLADQGADVVKIEPPAGDNTRSVATERGGMTASFLNNNRNKRSVVLDLKRPGGREALMRLVAGSDVVMQNFRPGVADRLGIGYEAARAVRPDVIYVSICGFGETGPYASKPVFDPLVQSLSGLTTVQAASDERRPALVRTILPDKLTGFAAAQAIAAALFARERTGQGQHIRLSMLDTVIHFLWSSDMGNHTFVGQEAEVETSQSFIDLIYQTLDGHISVAGFRRRDWERLADAVGRPEWKEDPRFLTSAGLEIHKSERLEMTQDALGRADDGRVDRDPGRARRALRARADASRDDPPPADRRQRADRRGRPPRRRPPAPDPPAGPLRGNADRAPHGRPSAGPAHPRGAGRGRSLGRGNRRAGGGRSRCSGRGRVSIPQRHVQAGTLPTGGAS
jgi:crotonobetainyl-CoA:carnitine CoA-transferase CaiB-like acyl-CoA transferase